MTIEDTVAKRPRPRRKMTQAPAGAPLAEGWTQIANAVPTTQVNEPTLAYLDQLYLYGGDGENGMLHCADGADPWAAQTGDWTPPRNVPSGAVFRGELMLVGGDGANDTWSAPPPGARWNFHYSKDTSWGPRWGHALAVFNGNLYMLGGVKDGSPRGDVWLWDGMQWQQPSPSDSFKPMAYTAAASVGGLLYVLGGRTASGPLAEAQVTRDGYNFLEQIVPWPARENAQAVTLGDTLYLLGGHGTSGTLTDVWATQGQGWAKLSSGAPPLESFGAAAVGDHIVVAGGTMIGKPNPTAWAFKPPPIGWSQMSQTDVFVNEHSLTSASQLGDIICGWGGWGTGAVYRSDNRGMTWTRLPGALPPRFDMAGTKHNGKLFASAGTYTSNASFTDVYRSQDGSSWPQVKVSGDWPARGRHAMASFQGKLWLMAGAGEHGSLGDVWFSNDDGANWLPANRNAFRGRMGPTAVVFDNRLWLLGGNGGQPLQEALWTTDGVTWHTEKPDWGGRSTPSAVVVGKTLYVFGGIGNGGRAYNDLWATRDGKTWAALNSGGYLSAWDRYAATVLDDDSVIALGGVVSGIPNPRIMRLLPVQ